MENDYLQRNGKGVMKEVGVRDLNYRNKKKRKKIRNTYLVC